MVFSRLSARYARIYYLTCSLSLCLSLHGKPFSCYALHAFCHILTYFCGMPQPAQSTVRIVQANRHIWCQLEREEVARRRPFYFPQPPHYRHVVSSIAHWPSPLWRRKWKVTRNFLGNSRLRRFTINCWQFRLIVHHAWLSVNCHCLALSLCLSISISLSSKTCTNAH